MPCACKSGNVWDSLADSYDSRISLDETVMGLRLLRRYVIRQAKVSPPPPPRAVHTSPVPSVVAPFQSAGRRLEFVLQAWSQSNLHTHKDIHSYVHASVWPSIHYSK